jgi:hypothetical protein
MAARRGSKRQTGATFVDPNSWIRNEDFGKNGLHLSRYGARQMGDFCS